MAGAAFAGPQPAIAAPSAAERDIFLGSVEDPPARKLLGVAEAFEGRHYTTGDEFNPNVWFSHVQNLGGGYVGVGSDQAYLNIGWARPEWAWLIDYDPLVLDLHAIYRIFLTEAASVEEFLQFWAAGREAVALDRIDHHFADSPKHKTYREIYSRNRANIWYRFTLLRRQMQKVKTPCWLTDPEMYSYVRALVMAGRVRPISANLLENKGILGIAAAARKLGVTVRLLYLSNAEEYWTYGRNFRENIAALPMDEKSRVLRTLSSFSANRDYRYNVQPGLLFQAWLARPQVLKVRQIVNQRRELKDPSDVEITFTEREPPAMPKTAQPKIAQPKPAQPKPDQPKTPRL